MSSLTPKRLRLAALLAALVATGWVVNAIAGVASLLKFLGDPSAPIESTSGHETLLSALWTAADAAAAWFLLDTLLRWLNVRFASHRCDAYLRRAQRLYATIAGLGVCIILVPIPDVPVSEESTPADLLVLLLAIAFIALVALVVALCVTYLRFGLKLLSLSLRANTYGLLRPYTYAAIAGAGSLLSIVLSPLGLLLVPVNAGLLAAIFYLAAEEQDVLAYERASPTEASAT